MSTNGNGDAAGAACARRSALAIALACLPVILDGGSVAAAAALRGLADGPSPYAAPGHELLVLLRMPLAVVSGMVLFLAPGLLLASRSRVRGTPDGYLLRAFGWALLWNGALVALAGGLGLGAGGRSWALTAALVAMPLVVFQLIRPPEHDVPRGAAQALVLGLATSFVLASALAPKFLWESFNGDGAHAYEATRLLLRSPVPFFPEGAGVVGGFPGVTSCAFAYPGAWFLRLFGPLEASARFPVLLYLLGLVAAVCAASRAAPAGPRDAVSVPERLALLTCSAAYLVALAFSASYSPYSADIALPATQDTLLMAVFVGFVWAHLSERTGWTAFFAAATYASLPSGLLLLGGFLVLRVATERPRPKAALVRGFAVLSACFVAAAIAPHLLQALGLPRPGVEYASGGLARRFLRLQFTDVGRILFAALPAGIVPFAALFLRKPQDAPARALTLLTLGYFLFFYVQAHISLHHFVPAMVLPWIVYLRADDKGPLGGPVRRGVIGSAGAAVALFLVMPASARPYTEPGRIGRTLIDATPGYESGDPAAFDRALLLKDLFPLPFDVKVPADGLGVSPTVWPYYAARPSGERGEPVYRIQPIEAPVPVGAAVRVEGEGQRLLVLDPERAAADMGTRPPTETGARLLRVPRGLLFEGLPLEGGPPILDLRAWLRGLRDGVK